MKQSKFYIAVVLVFSLVVVAQNCRLRLAEPEAHRPGQTGPDVIAQLNGLSHVLEKGGATKMQDIFPEGYVFTWVLYGLSWVQVGMNEEGELRGRAERQARRAVEAIDSPEGRAPFVEAMIPSWGVFYNSWLAWLAGGLVAISEEPRQEDIDRFVMLCDRIADALQRQRSPYLQSYPGESWPADTVVGIAALRLHDHLFEPRFEEVVDQWLVEALARADQDLNVLAHRSDAGSGLPMQGARGCSQALMLRFLIDIDQDLAIEHYARFREHFAQQSAGMVVGFREYHHGRDDGWADVDSGPIIFGYAGPATVVGMGAALIFGDYEMSDPIIAGIELIGVPHGWGGRKHYGVGLLPVGDAFVVWSKTARPWIADMPQAGSFEPMVGRHWRWRWHLLSMLLLALVWGPVLTKVYKARRLQRRLVLNRD